MPEKPSDKESWATWKAPGSSEKPKAPGTPETPSRLHIRGLVVGGEKPSGKEGPEPVSRLRGDLVRPRLEASKLRGSLITGREATESKQEFRIGDTIEVKFRILF